MERLTHGRGSFFFSRKLRVELESQWLTVASDAPGPILEWRIRNLNAFGVLLASDEIYILDCWRFSSVSAAKRRILEESDNHR